MVHVLATSLLPDPTSWRHLLSLTKKEADDRLILGEHLGRWCEAQGGAAAALYGEVDGTWTRVVETVAGAFPRTLAEPQEPAAPGDDPGWRRVDLPGGVLLHTAAKEIEAATDPTLLLLASGVCVSFLKRELQRHSFEAKFRGVELEALFDVGLAIASSLDLKRVSEEVLLRAVSLLDARRGALYLFEAGRYRLYRAFGGPARPEFDASEVDRRAMLEGKGGLPEELVPGARHFLAVPIEIDRDPRGLLVAADKESRRGVGPFPAADRRTLLLFANQAAIALENAKLHQFALEKERLEREMELAAEIQQQILPKGMPEIPGFEVTGWNRPARQVGGDYYDVWRLVNGHWCLVVGDVTGKGMPAALLVSTLHSSLRLLLDHRDVDAGMVARLNRHVSEASAVNKFITMIIASLDAQTSELTYLNAGHNPGLLVRRSGVVEELSSKGLPLGLLADVGYQADRLGLEPGDLLCLYSDGITECTSPEDEEFGLERLAELLRAGSREPLPQLIQTLDRAVSDFAAGQPQGDDQTVVLLRRC